MSNASGPRHVSSRRARLPRNGGSRPTAVAFVLVIGAIFLAVIVGWSATHHTLRGSLLDGPTATSEEVGHGYEPASRQGVFAYSVIPGGAYSKAELARAITQDPPVAAHYRDVSLGAIRSEVVAADRWAHMSYRVGDQIFWTKRKLLLHRGETILTDGAIEVRGRCGNRISLQPMAPTADTEPETIEFDGLMADDPPPVLVSRSLVGKLNPWAGGLGPADGRGAAVLPSNAALSAIPIGLVPAGGNSPVLSLPGGVASSSDAHAPETLPPSGGEHGAPVTAGPGAATGATDPVGAEGSSASPEAPTAPASAPPVLVAGEGPSGTNPGGTPVVETGGGPADDPTWLSPPLTTVAPIVTPEPGTLFLVGGGIAFLIRQRRRSKR
jgi:hypothetical protein